MFDTNCGKGGEQCLEDFEFCNLGSINLDKMYDEKAKDVNWNLLKQTIHTAIRFLDNIIDVNEYVLPQFKEKVLGNRKIGLGITGFAHLLIKLGIRYDSEKCLNFIDDLFGFIKATEEEYNRKLALEKGNFPTWHESIFSKMNIQRRNATISTQAPTGSISTILNTESYGIEPIFSVGYIRRIVGGEIFEVNQLFKKMLHEEVNDEDKEKEILRQCIEKGTTNLDCVPKKLRELFRCANDISPEWHIKVMAQLQKYYDNAISKTINLPESATKDDVKKAYILAFKLGCKGCTIYRNNSRNNQTIQIGTKLDKNNNKVELKRGFIIESSDDMIGRKRKLMTGCGSLHLQAWYDPITGELMEVFLSKGSNGGCNSYMTGLSRMISLTLRSGTPFEAVIDQLKSVTSCPSYVSRTATKHDTSPGSCCPVAIANALLDMQKEINEELGIEENKNKPEKKINEIKSATNESKSNYKFTKEEKEYLDKNGEIAFALKYNKCPICGNKIEHIDGCISDVTGCGWTKCS